MLESLEQSNIKRMYVEIPESGGEFDPETQFALPLQKVRNLIESVDSFNTRKEDLADILRASVYLEKISSTLRPKMTEVQTFKYPWLGSYLTISNLLKGNLGERREGLASIVFTRELDILINEDYEFLRREISKITFLDIGLDPLYFAQEMYYLKQLGFEPVTTEPRETSWQEDLNKLHSKAQIGDYAELAFYLNQVNPEEFKIHLTEDETKYLEKILEMSSVDPGLGFPFLAYILKELQPKELEKSEESMPEQRNF